MILIENKTDRIKNYGKSDFLKDLKKKINKSSISDFIGISTFNNDDIEKLKNLISKKFEGLINNNDPVISNARHYNALKKCLKSLDDVLESLNKNISGDLLSVDLKESINQIGSITGKIDIDQDILGSIFSKFCIGK